MDPGEETQTGSEKGKDELSPPPHHPALAKQLPATLLKISAHGPGPGHSAPGLEVAQSWGNPGGQCGMPAEASHFKVF